MPRPRTLSDAEIEFIGQTVDKFGGEVTEAAGATVRHGLHRYVSDQWLRKVYRSWKKGQLGPIPEEPKNGDSAKVGETHETFTQPNSEPTTESVMTIAEMELELHKMASEWLRSRRLDAKTAMALADKITRLKEAGAGQSTGMTGELAELWQRLGKVSDDPLVLLRAYVEYCEDEDRRFRREGWANYQAGPFAAFAPDMQQALDRLQTGCTAKGISPVQCIAEMALVVEGS